MRDVAGADLELERGRHAVAHHQPVRFLLLSVLVQVDEPGRDDETRRVDHARARERRDGDRFHATAANADVADRVEIRLRVHHAPVGDDEIVRRGATAGDEENAARRNVGRMRYLIGLGGGRAEGKHDPLKDQAPPRATDERRNC